MKVPPASPALSVLCKLSEPLVQGIVLVSPGDLVTEETAISCSRELLPEHKDTRRCHKTPRLEIANQTEEHPAKRKIAQQGANAKPMTIHNDPGIERRLVAIGMTSGFLNPCSTRNRLPFVHAASRWEQNYMF